MDTVKNAYAVIEDKKEQLKVHKFELQGALDDVISTTDAIKTLPDKLEHKVMIPVGPLAFMEGNIVHTNELMCSLGKDYFVKKTSKSACELLERRKAYIEEKMKGIEEEVKKVNDYYQQLRFLESQTNPMKGEEMQEIIEYIPNEGEPVLISGPKPAHTPEKQSKPLDKSVVEQVKKSLHSNEKEDWMMRSMDLDSCFIQERGKGVIEENEVLTRGEWKQPHEEESLEEKEEEEEEIDEDEENEVDDDEEIVKEPVHCCHYCGKENVTSKCSRCKTVWYCSRDCQLKDWPNHKKQCKEIVKTSISTSQVEEKMPKKDRLKIVEDTIIEKKVDSIKPVVVEREYAKEVKPEAIEEVERKPKRKSLFRQNFEKSRNL